MKKILCSFLIVGMIVGSFQSCEKSEFNDDQVQERALKSANTTKASYIVVLDDTELEQELSALDNYAERQSAVRAASARIMKRAAVTDGEIEQVYGKAIKGFSVMIPPGQLKKLENDPAVKYIEKDKLISLVKPASLKLMGDLDAQGQTTPYGISRVSGGATYGDDAGETKSVWIIDTGIDLDHPDLHVDASRGAYFTGRGTKSPDDDNGHGSHVAGTIAAINNGVGVIGVAAGATVIPVKVLDRNGSGSTSGVIAGIDHVAAYADPGDVANMSLGGGISTTLDDAVVNASNNGIYFSLAAGNESDDANNHSPARANGTYIYTISAMDANDNFASFSNYGNPPVDFCEPGVSILSTYKDGQYATASGTSMAAPHMAGILVWGLPVQDGTVNNDPDGNADPIGIVGGGETPNNAPTSSFTYSATDLTVTFSDASSDSDGTIISWSWIFGDGSTSTAQNPTHTYSSAGTYTVQLTVTDNEGATGSSSQNVTVSDQATGDILLTATARKVRGMKYVDLTWTGNSGNVNIYKDGILIQSNVPESSYTDDLGRISGTFTYRVCETGGTSGCSNEVTITI